jgi:hypothetical protein
VSPLRFYLTRNEWRQAERHGETYCFHVWDLTTAPARLHERSVEQVREHIPLDQCKGKWETAIIPVIG